jgi:1-deoxy-D-xylulose-5-phosphate reductoisomerase
MNKKKKRLAILGSTGSLGNQAIDVIRAFPHLFQIVGLAAGSNTDLLLTQIKEFKPDFIYCSNGKINLSGMECEFLSLEDIAGNPMIDTVVITTSGKASLEATLSAVKAGKTVILGNKESLVMAGEIITTEAKNSGAQILPVDGEHSAIWQCLRGETEFIAQLILTASGGPFRNHSPAQLEEVTVEQALGHPTWRMGKKITIDSATLMNKGLEVIEAHWLFNVPIDNIRVIIHPQSIIHSMVEFTDGSVKAQISYPDMRLPIQHALTYPERLTNPNLPVLDWDNFKDLTFEQPDFDTFPCLRLAIESGKKGGTYPAVLCAADETAVELFLSGKIRFTDIASLVEQALSEHNVINNPTIDDIMSTDTLTRERVIQIGTGDS